MWIVRLALVVLCLNLSSAFAADALLPEHLPESSHEVVIERTASAYRVGDFVDVLDADGRTFTVQIKRIVADGVEFETASGDVVQLPAERIIEKVGLWARSWAWLTDTTAGNWTMAGGGGLLALGAGKVVTDAQVASDKDTDQVPAAELAAREQAAASAAIVQGPVTREKFWISGEFRSTQDQIAAAGAWTPAITFGSQASLRGGTVASYLLPPAALGQPAQIVTGQGSWVLSSEAEIYIEGTSGLYDGHARLLGTITGGTGPSTLRTKGGAVLSGGTVTSVVQGE